MWTELRRSCALPERYLECVPKWRVKPKIGNSLDDYGILQRPALRGYLQQLKLDTKIEARANRGAFALVDHYLL